METESELDDFSPPAERRKEFWIPAGLVVLWGFWDLSVFRLFDPNTDNIPGILAFGPFYAQPVLAAMWGAWGPGRAVVRWPVAFGLVVLQAVVCTMDTDMFEALFALATAFVSCFVLLLVGRRVTGWSIHYGEGKGVSSENSRYGVRYLLGLTTFVALLAGLAKATDAVGRIQSEFIDLTELAVVALVLVVFTAPLALLFIVILMSGPRLMARLAAVLLIGVVATLVIGLVMQIQWGGSVEESLVQTGTLLVGASASVGVSAAALRWAGYRVGRKQGTPGREAAGSLEGTT